MQSYLFQWLSLLVVAFSSQAVWADSQFDACVNSLYKAGGLSLRESQELCLKRPSPAQLTCQNSLFQIAFRTPQDSYNVCMGNPLAGKLYKGQAYRGIFSLLPSGQKKTVCSITVNSEEERNSFKKILPSDRYEFVELLPEREQGRFISRDYHWLERSCQAKLRCDVLVFSGHFADSFIGDAGFEISMRELRKFRSQERCDDFFNSIKEVYLFGCNTLATKKSDHRSIDQYLQILVEDGVAPHTAQRIAARRYTPYDHSVSEKMSEIFSSANFIAGFPSTGPTGSRIQKTLERYLEKVQQEPPIPEKLSAFRQTLGRLGMIYTEPVKVSEKNIDVKNYAKIYGNVLPVATVDLLEEAFKRQLLTIQEMTDMKIKLKERWLKLEKYNQRLQLCPLLLADHDQWLPPGLDCYNDTEWLRVR